MVLTRSSTPYEWEGMPLGPEPRKFVPERFLLNNRRHPFIDLPFSAGPRNYIGTFFSFPGHVLWFCSGS